MKHEVKQRSCELVFKQKFYCVIGWNASWWKLESQSAKNHRRWNVLFFRKHDTSPTKKQSFTIWRQSRLRINESLITPSQCFHFSFLILLRLVVWRPGESDSGAISQQNTANLTQLTAANSDLQKEFARHLSVIEIIVGTENYTFLFQSIAWCAVNFPR